MRGNKVTNNRGGSKPHGKGRKGGLHVFACLLGFSGVKSLCDNAGKDAVAAASPPPKRLKTKHGGGDAAATTTVVTQTLRPRFSRILILGFAIFSLLLVSGCRLDMHIDPRYDPFSPSTFFPDGRSERPLVPGTVARGHLRTDELLYTGRVNGQPANEFPFPITKADLKRGQQRYDIYCTPCHDYTGSGEGMIVRRGFPAPPSYRTAKLVNAPVGHFFDVMTNGYGTMYSYADRVSVKDRWRIAAYIRALQLSQDATLNDVPASERLKLMMDKGK